MKINFDSFHATSLFLYSLKTSENQTFSDDQWHEIGPLHKNYVFVLQSFDFFMQWSK